MNRIMVSAVAAVLMAGIVSCRDSTGVTPSVESILQLFPSDTYGVLFVDVAGLRENPLADELVRERSAGWIPDSMEGFSDWTGLDFGTDIDEIAVGAAGSDQLLAVARVRYDPGRVVSYFSENGFPVRTHGGHLIYHPDSTEDWKLCFLDEFVLMGPEASIRQAIDRIENADPTALDNPQLVDGLRSVSEGYHVWAVGTPSPGLLPDGISAPQVATDLFGSLERGTYQMRLDEIVTGRAVGEFATPELASRTSSLLQGLVTLGRIEAARVPGLGELLDGLEIKTVESAVHLDFVIDADAFGRLSGSGRGSGN